MRDIGDVCKDLALPPARLAPSPASSSPIAAGGHALGTCGVLPVSALFRMGAAPALPSPRATAAQLAGHPQPRTGRNLPHCAERRILPRVLGTPPYPRRSHPPHRPRLKIFRHEQLRVEVTNGAVADDVPTARAVMSLECGYPDGGHGQVFAADGRTDNGGSPTGPCPPGGASSSATQREAEHQQFLALLPF